MTRRFIAILSFCGFALLFWAGPAFADAMPPVLREYARGIQGTLNEMVVSDAGMMKEAGLTPESLKAAQLKFPEAFELHRIDGPGAAAAHELTQALQPTGIYFVPYCADGKCPLVAAFTLDKATKAPAFVSVGQPKFTERLRDAETQLRGEPELDASSRRVVEFPEAHASFHVVKRVDTGEEVLVPHSHDEAQSLLQMVKNPAELQNGRTKTRGLYQFRFQHLSEISQYLKEHATMEAPPSSAQQQGELQKPMNFGARTANARAQSRVRPAGQGGAVMELVTPSQGSTSLSPTGQSSSAIGAPVEGAGGSTPSVESPEHASTNVPAFGILALLSVGSICGLGACVLRKAKN